MPAELVKRVNLDLLYLPFLERVLNLLAYCHDRGTDYYVVSGTRLWREQRILRMRYLAKTGGRAAPPGYSQHQFGLAVDVAFDASPKRGLQPRWKDADYDLLGKGAKLFGLHWGVAYNDRPHIGWPAFVTGKELAPLRKVWAETPGDEVARLDAVWHHVDQFTPEGVRK